MKEDYLLHYGTPRHSGRYPWGSGKNPYQDLVGFQSRVKTLRDKGMKNGEIAKSFGMSTSEFLREVSRVKTERRAYEAQEARRLFDKGWSKMAIGRRLGKNESSVRGLLDEALRERNDAAAVNAKMLKDKLSEGGYLDISVGVPERLGISKGKLDTAVAMLVKEGYCVHKIRFKQLGTGKDTTFNVLCPPGTTWAEVMNHKGDIRPPDGYFSEDGGRTLTKVEPPISVDSKRVGIRYAEDGGLERDGLVELRRGVDDISLGNAKYAQVRIGVDGTHYIKGMAVYSDDLPPGIDILVNSNKPSGKDKMDYLKPMEKDLDGAINKANPFGTSFRQFDDQLILAQRHYTDANGKRHLSALNIVNEEGDWGRWSRSLASQFLSKQSPALAKQQLDIHRKMMQEQFEEIKSLTNPVLRAKLLEDFAGQCDSDATHLQAAALPRQAQKVILPVPNLREGEVYAPHLKDGEHVVLVRYPHGGTFELPNLIVNNKSRIAKNMMGNAIDAIGINPATAQQLSGADFDGDSVVCIPVDHVRIKTSPYIQSLKGFDAKAEYPGYEGMHAMTKMQRGIEMGKVTNLIADMTLMGASGKMTVSDEELARAVKHSMVVVDAYKHKLDYRRSEIENGIPELKLKYQGKPNGGASTLITKAGADVEIPERREKYVSELSPEERVRYLEGKLVYKNTGATDSLPKENKDGTVEWAPHTRTMKVPRMMLHDDAYELVSGGSREATTPIERVYADHANAMKAMANEARKEARATIDIRRDPSAAAVYAAEVDSLKAKVNEARKKSPMERRAQIIAGLACKQIFQDNPQLREDVDKRKKIVGMELDIARRRVGNSEKPAFWITDREWEAISAGAVSKTSLKTILTYADSNRVKQLATPKVSKGLTPSRRSSIRSLYKNGNGYPITEIAAMLGVSTSTVESVLLKKDSD